MREAITRVDVRTGHRWRMLMRRVPGGDAVAVNTTDLGSMYMVAGASLALWWTRPDLAVGVNAAGSAGWVVSQRIKRSFMRTRPYEADPTGTLRLIAPPTGSSFPSGHAAVAAAVGTVMAADSRRGRRWPWWALAAWVPLTRVQLGVHYPSDVVGGAMLGWGLGRMVLAARKVLPRVEREGEGLRD